MSKPTTSRGRKPVTGHPTHEERVATWSSHIPTADPRRKHHGRLANVTEKTWKEKVRAVGKARKARPAG